jgi:hypothetical protein
VKNILVALKDTDIDFDAMGGAGCQANSTPLSIPRLAKPRSKP